MGKFCGKCGKPIESCTCSDRVPVYTPAGGSTRSAGIRYSTVAHLDEIALGEGEQRVKEYALGKYPLGCGKVNLIITNKRVILKEHYSLLFLSHDMVEELNLESVHGVNGNIGRGMNRFMFVIGLIIALLSLLATIFLPGMTGGYGGYGYSRGGGGGAGGLPIFILILGIVIMALSCIFPYMTFGIIGMGSDHQSLTTGINTIGKTGLNRGAFFQPRPAADARKSIAEAGACIFDLRTYGDEAIEKWTRS